MMSIKYSVNDKCNKMRTKYVNHNTIPVSLINSFCKWPLPSPRKMTRLASEVVRLIHGTQRYFSGVCRSCRGRKQQSIYSAKGLHLVHKNVSRLASKVPKLIYSTQRYSSGVCRSCRGRKCWSIHFVKGLLISNNDSRLPVRLVDSFTAPKDILQEFTYLAEEENVDLSETENF